MRTFCGISTEICPYIVCKKNGFKYISEKVRYNFTLNNSKIAILKTQLQYVVPIGYFKVLVHNLWYQCLQKLQVTISHVLKGLKIKCKRQIISDAKRIQ